MVVVDLWLLGWVSFGESSLQLVVVVVFSFGWFCGFAFVDFVLRGGGGWCVGGNLGLPVSERERPIC